MDPERLHADSLVLDAVCPLASKAEYLDWYRQGGVTALAPTVGSTESARRTLDVLGGWHRLLRERDDLMLIRRAADLSLAKEALALGLWFHLQGTNPIEDNLDLVDVYKQLGVGVVQLAYNVRNAVGDGCEEPGDAGLSRFGARLVERLNAARVIVDCSHTGLRTSLDAIGRSSAPVVLSHSNPAWIHPSPRNAPAELADAIAESGGLVGIVGFPAMVGDSAHPTLDRFIDHIAAVADRVGIAHVGLGIDYYLNQHGVARDEDALRGYRAAVASGVWSTAYPPPPHRYPDGIADPRLLTNLTRRMLGRGFSSDEVRAVLGLNWRRVMAEVWGE